MPAVAPTQGLAGFRRVRECVIGIDQSIRRNTLRYDALRGASLAPSDLARSGRRRADESGPTFLSFARPPHADAIVGCTLRTDA